MADQVDLAGTGFLQDRLDLQQQLFAAHLVGVDRRHLHRNHRGPAPTQRRDDPVPVRVQHQANKPEHARDQHHGVARGGALRHVKTSL